jgi:hypothetical protein
MVAADDPMRVKDFSIPRASWDHPAPDFARHIVSRTCFHATRGGVGRRCSLLSGSNQRWNRMGRSQCGCSVLYTHDGANGSVCESSLFGTTSQ